MHFSNIIFHFQSFGTAWAHFTTAVISCNTQSLESLLPKVILSHAWTEQEPYFFSLWLHCMGICGGGSFWYIMPGGVKPCLRPCCIAVRVCISGRLEGEPCHLYVRAEEPAGVWADYVRSRSPHSLWSAKPQPARLRHWQLWTGI